MQICKYKREQLDYYKIVDKSNLEGTRFPKKVSVDAGQSSIIQVDNDWFFKRKTQDGNISYKYSLPDEYGVNSRFFYEELKGSLDDLSEVLCYTLAKNCGKTIKYANNGNPFVAPVLDCTEYRLAEYIDKNGETQRGCISRNIAKPNTHIIKGTYILHLLNNDSKPRNTLPNYIKALNVYAQNSNIILDNNIVPDLVVNSYFSYKNKNGDANSNNIIFTQTKNPDGTIVLSANKILDNAASWILDCPYKKKDTNGCVYNRYQDIFQSHSDNQEITEEEASNFTFKSSPINVGNAFHLDAGDLNGHPKTLGEKQLTYEYDLVAHALSDPRIYERIYTIEQKYNPQKAFDEVSATYNLNWPPYLKQTIQGTADYTSRLIENVMSDYFCYTAFSNCIQQVDTQNPTELYCTFQEQMQQLPLQESIDGYFEEFIRIAQQNQIEISAEKLSSLQFLPNQDILQEQNSCEETNQ